MRGKLITFEGVEGSGKDTQIKRLSDCLKEEGRNVVVYREPGSTPAGAEIRRILLKPDYVKLLPEAELLLYYAARSQFINDILIPELGADKVVICNRYDDSSRAYQGYGRGIDLKVLNLLKGQFVKVEPDLTILLDIPVGVGLARKGKSIDEFGKLDRMESEACEFHNRVRYGYLEMAWANQKRFRIVDGSLSEDAVFSCIYQHINQLLQD